MRFRRRAKLFPGVYLNFSKSGISTSIGVQGASITLGKKGTYLNAGIPGTGIYDRKRISGGIKDKQTTPENEADRPGHDYLKEDIGAIKTENTETTTTKGLLELKKTLVNCYQEKNDLKKEIEKAKHKLKQSSVLLVCSYILLLGLFIKWFRKNNNDNKAYLEELGKQLKACFVNIDIDVEDQFKQKYTALLYSYKTLLSCEKIWDITSSVNVDKKVKRSTASTSITRRPVKFGYGNIDIIKSVYDALHFGNANGDDLYIYPAFVAIFHSDTKFGLVDIRELDFSFKEQHFLEEEGVPEDALVIEYTWMKVNKDGTPDKRFKTNYQIPICKYGEIKLTSTTGLQEAYAMSSYEKSEKFAQAMSEYQKIINQD